jgi:hypothetical protein
MIIQEWSVVDEVEGRDPLSMTKKTMKVEKNFSCFYEETTEMNQAMKNSVNKLRNIFNNKLIELKKGGTHI